MSFCGANNCTLLYYTDFEFIIVNDGSTNNSEEVILSYKDERIKYLKQENQAAIVGAGSVVTHDVEPWTIVAGNPAKVIKRIKH